MKKILENLALIELNNFCEAQGINASGSRVQYAGRFKYDLVTVNGGELLASVQFHKSQVPTHYKPLRDDLTGESAKPAETQGEHTPGPWRVVQSNASGKQTLYVMPGGDNPCIASFPVSGNGQNPSRNIANARLIAAAPELLAMVEILSNHVAHYAAMPHAHSHAHKHAAVANALIRKATGK